MTRELTRTAQPNSPIFPEPFIWHVWHSLANVLVYQTLGHNASSEPLSEWEEIIHGDLKPANILMSAPSRTAHGMPYAQYPTIKAADYDFAFTIPPNRPDVRAFKSSWFYGTEGYMAPEVRPERDESDPVHGSHSDVYSAACVVQTIYNLFRELPEGSERCQPIWRPLKRAEQGVSA